MEWRYRVRYRLESERYDETTGNWVGSIGDETTREFEDPAHIHRWMEVCKRTHLTIHVVAVDRQPVDPTWEPVEWPMTS